MKSRERLPPNSLSQDFINLDDQPSQTLPDTPGFKPFTLKIVIVSYKETYQNFRASHLTLARLCQLKKVGHNPDSRSS